MGANAYEADVARRGTSRLYGSPNGIRIRVSTLRERDKESIASPGVHSGMSDGWRRSSSEPLTVHPAAVDGQSDGQLPAARDQLKGTPR